jgi:hypothetical protein
LYKNGWPKSSNDGPNIYIIVFPFEDICIYHIMAHTEAHTEAMGSDLNTDPNILESSPSPYDTARHHNSELKQSISAWKQRAKSARKDADKAEA